MPILFNDACLNGTYTSISLVTSAIGRLMGLRRQLQSAGHGLRVCSTLIERRVTKTEGFKDLLYQLTEPQRRLIFLWFTKEGPWWDRPKLHSENEYFECNENLVTETSLAEAAHIKSQGESVVTISLAPSDFTSNPLCIVWRQREGTTSDEVFNVPNFWDDAVLQNLPPARSGFQSVISLEEFVQLEFGRQGWKLHLTTEAKEDLEYWVRTSAEVMTRAATIIASLHKALFTGIGKPEPLKHASGGQWSRRLTLEDRITYSVEGKTITILRCRFHYL